MEHVPVNSSMLRSVGYDPETKKLEVKFKNGKKYEYDNVSEEEHDSIVGADSVGKAFNEFLGGRK